jgi:hypothetical protein
MIKKSTVVWLVLAAIFSVGLGLINVPAILKLLGHGAETTAKIVRLDCENHNRAFYTFSIGTSRYSTSDIIGDNCRSLRSGDDIPIYYDATDPTISSTTAPRAALLNELVPIGLVCLFFPPMILAGWAWKNEE